MRVGLPARTNSSRCCSPSSGAHSLREICDGLASWRFRRLLILEPEIGIGDLNAVQPIDRGVDARLRRLGRVRDAWNSDDDKRDERETPDGGCHGWVCSANIPSDTKLARARQPLRLAPKPTRSRCGMLPHAETFVLVDRVADDCPVAD
jgi:hypothetical protein